MIKNKEKVNLTYHAIIKTIQHENEKLKFLFFNNAEIEKASRNSESQRVI